MNQPTQVNFFKWNVVNLPKTLTNEVVIESILVAVDANFYFRSSDLSFDTRIVSVRFRRSKNGVSFWTTITYRRRRRLLSFWRHRIVCCRIPQICDENIHVTSGKYQNRITQKPFQVMLCTASYIGV